VRCFSRRRFILSCQYKLPDNPTSSFAFDIEITDHGEHHGADKINKHIIHRIDQSDIDIAAVAPGFAVYNNAVYIQRYRDVAAFRVLKPPKICSE
jgi:hypothetical protein